MFIMIAGWYFIHYFTNNKAYPSVMEDRHKNFKDPMISSLDIKMRKYETPCSLPLNYLMSPF